MALRAGILAAALGAAAGQSRAVTSMTLSMATGGTAPDWVRVAA